MLWDGACQFYQARTRAPQHPQRLIEGDDLPIRTKINLRGKKQRATPGIQHPASRMGGDGFARKCDVVERRGSPHEPVIKPSAYDGIIGCRPSVIKVFVRDIRED